MAGGTFTAHNKVRPGAYINTRSETVSASGGAVSGIVTMPIVADYGPAKEVIEVNSGTNFNQLFGECLASENLRLINEALKRAATVLVYRVNGGEKATGEISTGVTATARYEGKIGNDIRVAVRANINSPDAFDVLTYLGSNLVDSQEGLVNASELEDNPWLTFSGEGALQTAAGVNLEGGGTNDATSGDYSDYMEAIATHEFNTMAITVDEETTKIAAVNFIKRMRDDEGMKCQAVVGGYAADHEGTINVTNGVVLSTGITLSPAEATAFVAGATASAAVNESLTYAPYDGAVDVSPRLTHNETVEALKGGELVFTLDKDRVVIEQDINSLTTFTTSKNQDFRKNRVLRVLDYVANDSKGVFLRNFIGSVDNNADGRSLFLANRIRASEYLQSINAIEDFEPSDLTVFKGEGKDAVIFGAHYKPVEAMEKLYQENRVH